MSDAVIKIQLADSRGVWCWKYIVAYTYEGWQFRTPSESNNEEMLKSVRGDAIRCFGEGWPIQVIQPLRQPGQIDYPPVRIAALFTSSPIRDEMDLSSLVVIWFQDHPLPIPDVTGRAAIATIDWGQWALDYLV
jgi:hypothetical protein